MADGDFIYPDCQRLVCKSMDKKIRLEKVPSRIFFFFHFQTVFFVQKNCCAFILNYIYPTETFTISDPRNLPIAILGVVRKRWYADFHSPKI